MMASTFSATALAALSSGHAGVQPKPGLVVLLGDSIFDNGVYVNPGDPAVIDQLRASLPPGWGATLAAVDGSISSEIVDQFKSIPAEATHLVVSSGGNDALMAERVMRSPADNVGQALLTMADVRDRFEDTYQSMLQALL